MLSIPLIGLFRPLAYLRFENFPVSLKSLSQGTRTQAPRRLALFASDLIGEQINCWCRVLRSMNAAHNQQRIALFKFISLGAKKARRMKPVFIHWPNMCDEGRAGRAWESSHHRARPARKKQSERIMRNYLSMNMHMLIQYRLVRRLASISGRVHTPMTSGEKWWVLGKELFGNTVGHLAALTTAAVWKGRAHSTAMPYL